MRVAISILMIALPLIAALFFGCKSHRRGIAIEDLLQRPNGPARGSAAFREIVAAKDRIDRRKARAQ